MTRMRIAAVALVLAAALLAAGCGGSDDTTTTTEWADGLCSAITTWKDSISGITQTLTAGNVTEDGLQSAVVDAKGATETFVDDVKGLGKPDTEAGQDAKDSVDQLGDELNSNVDTIESAVDDASGVSGVLSAVSVVSATLVTMGTELTTTLQSLQNLDAGQELNDAFAQASSCDGVVTTS